MLRRNMVLLLAFIIVPIAEIALLVHVGGLIGAWQTIGLVVLTAAIGTALFRAQGFRVMMRAQDILAQGGFPAKELFDGICVLLAGVLLLTPGFVTDALGLALLVPGLRVRIGRILWHLVRRSGNFEMHVGGSHGTWSHASDDNVIEGEFSEVPADSDPPPAQHLGKPGPGNIRR
ncbi:MAG: FxsA family protein [Alphaproteobacteria bacterium]|nr:MAG: FxsA family protein [Alphaproteobacteria bacterium]